MDWQACPSAISSGATDWKRQWLATQNAHLALQIPGVMLLKMLM
jgi:hypothetical protein